MKIILKPLEAQVAVVFGASSGIGRLTALEMAKRGAKICVAARSVEGLKSLVDEIQNDGGEAFYVAADAADFEQVKAVAEKCVERYGRIDTWVHSAGAFLFATVEKTEPDEYKRIIEVNLLGQIYGAKAALPYLKNSGGALIHVSSVEAVRTAPYQSAYGSSKHGLQGFLQVLRAELAHEKIPVSVTEILPAAINTPIYEKGRNKMDFKLRPVFPVYHPRVVADAILYAAENPVRDLIAGAAGLGVVYAERISPRAADFFSETIGFIGQNAGAKDSPEQFEDNLFMPITGYDTVEGNFSDEQFTSDPYTFVKTSPRAKNLLLFGALGAISGLLVWKSLKKEKTNNKTKSHDNGGNMKTEKLLEQADECSNECSISSAEKELADEAQAREVFASLKTKILNLEEWNAHSLLSSYALFDETGKQITNGKINVGLFIRIRLKGSGKYDWIRVIDFYEAPEEFIITVRPTFDPTAEKIDQSVISHFFTDESTNNFCLLRKERNVGFHVVGLNEKLNTSETSGTLENIRNVAVNAATYLGIQNGEWEKFCHHFMEDAAGK